MIRTSIARPRWVIAFWLIAAALLGVLALRLPGAVKAGGFTDPQGQSARGAALAENAFGDPANALQVVLSSASALPADVGQRIATATTGIPGRSGVVDASTHPELASTDGRTQVVTLTFASDNTSTQNQVEPVRAAVASALTGTGIDSHVTGTPALDYDLNVQSEADARTAEMLAFPLLIVVLLIIHRAVGPTVVTLAIAGLDLAITQGLGYLIARTFDVSNLFVTGSSLIGLAVSVDYCLFIIRRHRENLAAGMSPTESAAASLSTAGHAVRFGGLAVVAALGALFVARNMVFSSIAAAGMIATVVAVGLTSTLLPALLALLGHRFFFGRLPGEGRIRNGKSGLPAALRRPVLVGGAVALGLGAAVVPVGMITLEVPVASASILPSGADSRAGIEALGRGLDSRSLFPLHVLLAEPTSSTSAARVAQAANAITTTVSGSPLVSRVVSPSALGADGATVEAALAGQPRAATATAGVVARHDGSDVVRLLVVASQPPDSEAAHQLVGVLRDAAARTGVTAYVSGATAQGVDFDTVVERSLPLIIGIVCALSIVLLGAAFRSLLLPIVALGLNALVVGAALGLLTLLWVRVIGEAINSVTPVLLLATMFGLSMDYMVVMAARMREEYAAGHPHPEAIARGSARTATLVTSAAIIMIAVFLSFLVAQISIVRQLGVGLAIAVFLDAVIVRPYLMPAVLRLVGPRVWGSVRRRAGSHRESAPAHPADVTTAGPAAESAGHPLHLPARPRELVTEPTS